MENTTMQNSQSHGHGSYMSYSVGFIASLILTLVSYAAAVTHSITPTMAITLIALLALIQCIVQLVCFLHVGNGRGSRGSTFILCFTVFVLTILIGGSLWIMYHLNYAMTPQDINSYMTNQSDAV